MIFTESQETLRTGVEQLMLEEMVVEDANFLINGDYDDDIESVTSINTSSSNLFDTDDILQDDEYEDDEEYNSIFGDDY